MNLDGLSLQLQIETQWPQERLNEVERKHAMDIGNWPNGGSVMEMVALPKGTTPVIIYQSMSVQKYRTFLNSGVFGFLYLAMYDEYKRGLNEIDFDPW